MTRSLWKYFGRGFVALALIGAFVGCGDDDDTAPAGGKGGSTAVAGKGGSTATAGKGGSTGAAGKSSSAVSKDMCKTDVAKAVAAASAGTPTACIDCACTQSAAIVDACDKGCWELISCVSTMCPTAAGDALTACVTGSGPCASKLAMGGKASMVGPILTGACSSTCLPPPVPNDAGTPESDAGATTSDAGQ